MQSSRDSQGPSQPAQEDPRSLAQSLGSFPNADPTRKFFLISKIIKTVVGKVQDEGSRSHLEEHSAAFSRKTQKPQERWGMHSVSLPPPASSENSKAEAEL